jgi:serine/threonine-protein kinase
MDPTESRTCPACGTELPGDAVYCHSCGTEQPATVVGTPAAVAARQAALEAALRSALEPQYQLIRRIGRGGMGSVYLARDPVLKRSVSVKVLAPELAADETARTRFQREAQAVASLSHPNVVAIHSVGVLETGAPYFVMQYVEGGTLEERLGEEGPLELGEVRWILGQVASALEAAHAKGIIHRDVKPANVLYDPESDRVLVSDFGIAAVRPGSGMSGPTQLTQTGALVGTPKYMSPEQLLGEPVTEKTDIYGLGLLAYELVTGRSPFGGRSPQMVAAAHLKDAPPSLGETRPEADPELREIVRSCLAKEAEERPEAGELARRLHPSAGGLLEWPPPGLEGLQGGFRRPAVFLLIGSAGVLVPSLLGIAGGSFATTGWSSFAQTLGLAVALLGLLFLATGLAQLIRRFRDLRAALHRGHAWGTALEVLADARGDTGAVVTGSREYASLSAGERGAIRRGRLARSGMLVLAGVLLFPMFVLMAWLASSGVLSPGAAWLVPIVPSGVLLLGAGWLTWREHRRVADGRRSAQRRGRAERGLERVIGPWYERFHDLIGGEQPGPGPTGSLAATRVAVWLLVALVVGGVLMTLPVTAVTTSGGTILQIGVPQFSQTQSRIREVTYGRSWRVPLDSSITAAEAGRVFARLAPPRASTDARIYPALRVPPDTLTGPAYPPVCDTAFADGPDGAFTDAFPDLFERAHAGFTPEQRVCVRRVDAMPGLALLGTLARAPALDPWGSILDLPLPPTVAPHDIPIHTFPRVRGLAYAAMAKAASASAEGRHAEAERTLREVISMGYLLIDDGRSLITGLIGAVVAGLALDYLEDHYRLTGQAEAARRLAAARDSARDVSQAVYLAQDQARSAWRSSDPVTLREITLGMARDTAVIPALRWEMLRLMAVLPCTNTRELLFGPSPRLEAAWERARVGLVQTRADSAVFAVFEETLPRLARQEASNPFLGGVRLVGRVLGSDRLQGCAAVMGL